MVSCELCDYLDSNEEWRDIYIYKGELNDS